MRSSQSKFNELSSFHWRNVLRFSNNICRFFFLFSFFFLFLFGRLNFCIIILNTVALWLTFTNILWKSFSFKEMFAVFRTERMNGINLSFINLSQKKKKRKSRILFKRFPWMEGFRAQEWQWFICFKWFNYRTTFIWFESSWEFLRTLSESCPVISNRVQWSWEIIISTPFSLSATFLLRLWLLRFENWRGENCKDPKLHQTLYSGQSIYLASLPERFQRDTREIQERF